MHDQFLSENRPRRKRKAPTAPAAETPWADNSYRRTFDRWRNGKPPRWLRGHAVRVLSIPKYRRSTYSALHYAVGHLGFPLDHWGASVVRGEECLVSQPYGLYKPPRPTADQLAGIDTFCQLLGLPYELDERSAWYPGSTFSVIIYPPGTDLAALMDERGAA